MLRVLVRGAIVTERVSKSQFKAKALELFRQIEASGEPVVITDHGQPKLEVRPHSAPKRNPLEALRGTVLRYDEPFEPVVDDDWDAAGGSTATGRNSRQMR